jgi:hypothetical protein
MIASLIIRVLQLPTRFGNRQVETSGSGLHMVLVSTVIALVTLYCILRFPELGAIIAQYNQF